MYENGIGRSFVFSPSCGGIGVTVLEALNDDLVKRQKRRWESTNKTWR
jgi:hypothetical protein